jgi:hypothetical protein
LREITEDATYRYYTRAEMRSAVAVIDAKNAAILDLWRENERLREALSEVAHDR